ncbi:hypothetical protein KCM76_13785 [Zooshikella marina]|uniref:toxin VasX n=1 Tax=Zooshikella ganghwensis TaxID=202772 RepID=UPI001BB00BA9|nr:toxin VasX [Zooshikella ganghwensis]MBU2707061.1 hypothetical protein [Zooshikella ganghwensis]
MSDTSNNSPYGKPANREEARAEIVDGATVNGIAQCPVTEEFIYLYPTRYALVEKKVDYPSLRPGFSATIKPIGVRLARKGFVYLFHSLKPDELLSFEIQHDGEQSRYWEQKDQVGNPSFLKKPIKLKRQGYIEVAYSEVAWSASKIAELKADPRLRYEYMQRVQLSDYDFGDGATHLVPLSEIGNVLSECIGKEQAEKPAKRKHSLPFEWIDFSWSSLPLAGASTGKVLNETQGTSFNTALLVLHDMLGVLHDLDMHAECIYREKREWYEKNKQALHSGQFIRGLYHITKGDLNNHLKTSEDYQKLDELDQESLDAFTRIAELRNDAKLLREKAIVILRRSVTRNSDPHTRSAAKRRYDELVAQAEAKEEEAFRIEATLRRKHGSQFDHYKKLVENYYNGKFNMYKDTSMWNVPRIQQRVRTEEMERFLDDADALAQHITLLEEENTEDRAALLPRFNQAAWYFDPMLSDQVKHLHETHFCCIANLCGDAEGKGVKLAHKLYIEEFGEDNLASLFITNYSIFSVNEMNNASGSADDIKTILSSAKDVAELKSRLKLDQFPELTEHIELRGSLIAALTPAYLEEVTRTSNLVRNADTVERARRVIRTTGVGFDMLLVNAAVNDNLMIRLPDAAAANEFERALNELGKDQTIVGRLSDKRKKLRHKIKQALKRRDKATEKILRTELDALKQASFEKWQAIQDAEATIRSYISPIDNSKGMSGFKIDGLDQGEISTLHKHIENYRSGIWGNFNQGHTQESLKSSVKGIILPTLLAISNILNAFSTIEDIAYKQTLTGLDITEILADVFGAMTATASVGIELWRQSIEGGIERGNPFLVNKLGKVVIFSTLGLSFIDGVGALLDNFKKVKQVSDALEDDDYVAAAGNATSMVGNTLVLIGNARQGYYAFKAFEYARLHGLNYGAALARFAAPIASAIPWLVTGGVLILIGEAIYEIYKSPPIMVWIERCYWGNETQGWSYQKEQQQLADAIMRPRIEVQYYVDGYIKEGVYNQHPESVLTHNMVDVTVSIPGIKRSSFVVPRQTPPLQQFESPLQVGIAAANDYQAQDVTYYMLATTQAIFNNNMLQLKCFVSREALRNATSLSFKLISRPDMAYKPVLQDKNYVRYTVKLDEFQYEDDDKPGLVPVLDYDDPLPGEQALKLFSINDAWLNYAVDEGEADV